MKKYLILDTIQSPHDLKCLSINDLEQLAVDIREFLLENVPKTGGHFASNLGAVELTIALHYVFNTPDDLLVWDVGHQSYPHKILTGRRDMMNNLRHFGGIAGFPKRDESVYDTFGVGHSSTSISAALGMSVANKLLNNNHHAVAIIGDGAMTAGLAFEGLNNAGWLNSNLIVILNDNEMSISENVGAIRSYLSKILASRFYNSVKQMANRALRLIPPMQDFASKLEAHVKGIVTPSTMFEDLGFNYTGPIDGHDLPELIEALKSIKSLSGPQFLHVVTTKGQGYKLAEESPIVYHALTKNTILSTNNMSNLANTSQTTQHIPTITNTNKKILTYTEIFGMWLLDLAKTQKNFCAITPAMREGSGMVEFARLYPELFFDCGIAEQHAVTFAAGLATQGIKPIVAIYSTFLQRAYDQVIHDVAIQNLPVIFAIDRAGIVGADGPTHIGAFDISYLVCIPNMVLMAPSNENECYYMLWTAYYLNCPVAVRYPRGAGIGVDIIYDTQIKQYELGRGVVVATKTAINLINNHKNLVIFAFGSMVHTVTKIIDDLHSNIIINELVNISLCDMRFIKPLDQDLVLKMAKTHDYIVTIEENVVIGGAGSLVAQCLSKNYIFKPILNLGLPDYFIPHGDVKILLQECGLDEDGILNSIKNFMKGNI